MTRILTTIFLLAGLVACSKTSFQCHDFFQRISDDNEENLYIIGVVQEVAHKPVYAICLLSDSSGITLSDQAAKITSIAGHSINPSLRKKAIYALNSDYTLKEIPCDESQTNYLLENLGKVRNLNAPFIRSYLQKQLSFFPHTQIAQQGAAANP